MFVSLNDVAFSVVFKEQTAVVYHCVSVTYICVWCTHVHCASWLPALPSSPYDYAHFQCTTKAQPVFLCMHSLSWTCVAYCICTLTWFPWTTHSFVVFPGIPFVQLCVHLFVLWLCSEQAHCCWCHFVSLLFMSLPPPPPPNFKTCPFFIYMCSFCHAVVQWAGLMWTILYLLHESHSMLYSFLHLCVHLLSCSRASEQVQCSLLHTLFMPPPPPPPILLTALFHSVASTCKCPFFIWLCKLAKTPCTAFTPALCAYRCPESKLCSVGMYPACSFHCIHCLFLISVLIHLSPNILMNAEGMVNVGVSNPVSVYIFHGMTKA